MFGFVADIITSVVSILLPTFSTYKAIRTRDTATLTLWLIYWTTLALVLLAESQLYFFLRWIPLYSWIRLGAYVYLVAPGQKQGSFFIYKEYIHPFLYRHERQLDQILSEGNTRAFAIGWEIIWRGVQWAQTQLAEQSRAQYDMHVPRPAYGNRRVSSREQRQGPRFQELESDDDLAYDEYAGNGMYKGRTPLADQGGRRRALTGDETRHNGPSLGRPWQHRQPGYEVEDEYDSEEVALRRHRSMTYQAAVRDKEDALIQSALERISRARAKGKSPPNLTPEEIEALERRASQQPETLPPLATPPSTPSQPAKSKSNSRSNSSTSLITQKSKKRSSHPGSSSPAKSSSKSKSDRKSLLDKPSAESVLPFAPGTGPSGVMVPGPDGVPVYAPLVYASPSPEHTRSSSNGKKSRSRSNSMRKRRDSTPPERNDHYPQPPTRYYHQPPNMRPSSSNSLRSLPDDIEWQPPGLTDRRRSPQSASAHRPSTEDYDAPYLPAAQGRRSYNPAGEVRYSSVRRMPPPSSLGSGRSNPQHQYADQTAKRSGLSRELDVDHSTSSSSESDDSESESSSEEEQEVQVTASPRSKGGYSVQRAPAVKNDKPKKKTSRRR